MFYLTGRQNQKKVDAGEMFMAQPTKADLNRAKVHVCSVPQLPCLYPTRDLPLLDSCLQLQAMRFLNAALYQTHC